jgi:hypothetical protein
MAQILFDKILTVRKLEGEGQFTRRQAETLSKVMHDAMSAGVATKSGLSLTESALRADSEALKSDLKAEIGAVRHDLKVLETTLRSELKAEVGGLRSELKTEVAGLRSELKTQVAGLRGELKAEVAGLRGEVKADIAQATVQTIVWVGGIMVTLLVASGLMQHFLR